MDPKQQRQSQPTAEQPPVEPKTRRVCIISHATFGHYVAGYHLPRNKAVFLSLSPEDFDEMSNRPTPESWIGREISMHPRTLECIDEDDDRCTGRKAAEGVKGIAPAEPAKKIETIKVCGFSKHARGHYRGRCYWPPDSQRPIVHEVPKSTLRELEHDPHLSVMSPTRPDANGERKFFEPPGAITGAMWFEEQAKMQQEEAEEDSVFERVKKRKQEEDARRQRVTKVNGS